MRVKPPRGLRLAGGERVTSSRILIKIVTERYQGKSFLVLRRPSIAWIRTKTAILMRVKPPRGLRLGPEEHGKQKSQEAY
jgi:hypothetical protein